MKDLQALSERTGISEVDFKIALNIPLKPCPAKTIPEARNEYRTTREGGEEKAAAFMRWNELSLIDVEAAKNIPEILKAYHNSPDYSEAEVRGAEKLNALLLERIATVTKFDEALDLYIDALEGTPAQKASLLKIYELST